MLSRSFTKTELQLNQLKHKQIPPQIDFAILQDNTLKPEHFLIKHKEVSSHQKHDSHPILADYGTDQFSIPINDNSNDMVVKPLDSFSFRPITLFPTKLEISIKNITNIYINIHFYSMTLTLSAMTKTTFTQEFQKI